VAADALDDAVSHRTTRDHEIQSRRRVVIARFPRMRCWSVFTRRSAALPVQLGPQLLREIERPLVRQIAAIPPALLVAAGSQEENPCIGGDAHVDRRAAAGDTPRTRTPFEPIEITPGAQLHFIPILQVQREEHVAVGQRDVALHLRPACREVMHVPASLAGVQSVAPLRESVAHGLAERPVIVLRVREIRGIDEVDIVPVDAAAVGGQCLVDRVPIEQLLDARVADRHQKTTFSSRPTCRVRSSVAADTPRVWPAPPGVTKFV
jgi:hypothetical protein